MGEIRRLGTSKIALHILTSSYNVVEEIGKAKTKGVISRLKSTGIKIIPSTEMNSTGGGE